MFKRNAPKASSFEGVSDEQLETHFAIDRYGDFTLTPAVRPAYDLAVVPKEGYRPDTYTDGRFQLPALIASVSAERLFDVFMSLVETLADDPGALVEVTLENSDRQAGRSHHQCYAQDPIVLQSLLWDWTELLLEDGCTGIAVVRSDIPAEVYFDEHKLLIVYGPDEEYLAKFERVLAEAGVPCRPDIKFLTEAEHVHSSCDRYRHEFEKLLSRLGDAGWQSSS